jgi:hypothetical protein
MLYSQSPPLAEKEWRTGEEISSGRSARNRDDRADLRSGRRPLKAPIHSPHPSKLKDGEMASDRRSIGRRILRSLTRFSIAVLIGVGATLGWQSYGDIAKEVVIARAPTIAWLLSISTTRPPVEAATPAGLQQLAPLAFNLDIVRRSVEQLAARQEQMAQNIATLQAVDEDIRQKMSSTPPPPAPQAASIPQPKSPQSRAQSSAVPSSSVSRSPPPAGPQLSR